jgi:hypothetical protein
LPRATEQLPQCDNRRADGFRTTATARSRRGDHAGEQCGNMSQDRRPSSHRPAWAVVVNSLPRAARRQDTAVSNADPDGAPWMLEFATGGMLKRIAPIFPVRDLDASLAHYRRLGFATREYDGGGYGYATLDGIEIHLGVVPDVDQRNTRSSAYLWVEDADELAQAWRVAGADVRLPRTLTGASTKVPSSTQTAT